MGQLENNFCTNSPKFFQFFFAEIFRTCKFSIPKIALKNFKSYLYLSETKFSRLNLNLNKLL